MNKYIIVAKDSSICKYFLFRNIKEYRKYMMCSSYKWFEPDIYYYGFRTYYERRGFKYFYN